MAEQREPIVRAAGLTKVFRDFWGRPKAKAVNDITFNVEPGEVIGLLGPNGSGKSTTVKMLLGLLYPTGGMLNVLGRSPRAVETKREIGYLPEESYLYKYLTAEETLDFFGSLFNLSHADRKNRIDQLLDMVGMAHARRRRVGEFSKGMARRIGLAQAMINDPEFLILDEPTSGLDPLGCKEVKDLILTLKARGKTVLITSHLLSDVEDVCDRVIILYGGKIRAMGGLGELLTVSAENRIVTPALPQPAMNEVLRILRENLNGEEFTVDHPRRTLEEFFLDVIMPALIDSVETVENNAVYYRTEIRGSVYGEPFVQRITLAADAPTVEIENTIRWNEIRFVRLEQTFPFASEEEAEIRYGVPFGMVRYPETIYGGGVWPEGATRNIRLVRDWVDASDSKGGFTVGADHRMWTFDGNTLRNCMIRGIGWTSGGVILNEDGSQTGVQRPPKGEYTFRFRITPHGAERHPQYRTGWELNAPLRPVAVADATVSETPGLKLPAMPDSSGTTVVVSAVKPAESGRDVVFRCFESMGEAATLVLPEQEGGRWFETGLDEQHPVPAGTRIAFRPFEIKTLVRQNENSRQGVGER